MSCMDRPCNHGFWHPIDKIYAMAKTVDKYDLVRMVKPWAHMWLQNARERCHCIDFEDDWYSELMWAAWVFGDDQLLLAQIDRLVLFSYIDTEKVMMSKKNQGGPGDGSDDTSNSGSDDSNDRTDIHDSDTDNEISQVEYLKIINGRYDAMPLYHPQGEQNGILCFLGLAGMYLPSRATTEPIEYAVKLTSVSTEQIENARLEIITSLFEPVNALLDRRVIETYTVSPTTSSPRKGKKNKKAKRSQCSPVSSDTPGNTGAASAGLETIMWKKIRELLPEHCGIWSIPLPDLVDCKYSIYYLYTSSRELKDMLLEPLRNIPEHVEAVEKIFMKWDKIFENRPFTELSETQKAHLRRQREKAGVEVVETSNAKTRDWDWDCDMEWAQVVNLEEW